MSQNYHSQTEIRNTDRRLLEILVCPASRKNLKHNPLENELISSEEKLAYPIKDGIPIMLPDEARKIISD